MPTQRQKRVAKLIIENATLDKPLTGGEMLANVSYSAGLQKQPSRILESEGVREALNDYGFSEDNAKRVVAGILNEPKAANKDRLKASELVFKVHGTFAPEKSINLNANVDMSTAPTETQEIAREYEEKLKAKLLNEPTSTTFNPRVDAGEPSGQ
jgi:hypothetical protein